MANTFVARISVRCGFCKQRFMSELSPPRTIALHAATCEKVQSWMDKRGPIWYAYDFRMGNHDKIRKALMDQVECYFDCTPLKGRKVETVPCDARCTGARGPNCECSCGGANHGHGNAVSAGMVLSEVSA